MMRFRDDKPNANHKNVVDSIIQSIADGVEKDAVSADTLCLTLPYTESCLFSSLLVAVK